MKDWRKLPATLVAMFVIAIVYALVAISYHLTRSPADFSERYTLAVHGVFIALDVLAVAGFFELARRATGREALGFRIAALGTLLAILNGVFWEWWFVIHLLERLDTSIKIQGWVNFVVRAVPLLGVIVAASVKHRREALAGVIALIATDPVPTIARHMYGWASGYRAQVTLMVSLGLIATVALLWIAATVARPSEAVRPATEATSGLQTISSGLWLRVLAACTVAGLTLLLAVGKAGEGSEGLFKLASMSGAIVSAISLAMIAGGALRAVGGEVPSWPLLAGAIATLWALGVALAQLPETYETLYGAGSDRYGRDIADALTIVAPLVAIAGIAAFARAIYDFAGRRGLEQLRVEAQGKGLGFVTLMLASVGLQQWLLPQMTSQNGFVLMMLAAAACSLWATVLMARLCTLAADSLSSDPQLPTATLRA